MKIISLIIFLGVSFATQAQSKLRWNISVKNDSLETETRRQEPKGFFGKVLNTIRTVKEVIGDPSKLSVSLEDKAGKKESLKEYLKRKGPLKSKETYLPDAWWKADELLAWSLQQAPVSKINAS